MSRTSPTSTSSARSRCTICVLVKPSGMVIDCWICLPLTSVSMTARRLACALKRYSPARTLARLRSTVSTALKVSGLSITPSESSLSTMSGRSVCGAMKMSLSAISGPGSLSRLSAQTSPARAPTAMITRNDMKPLSADRVGRRLLGGFGGGGGGASGWRASFGDCGVILRPDISRPMKDRPMSQDARFQGRRLWATSADAPALALPKGPGPSSRIASSHLPHMPTGSSHPSRQYGESRNRRRTRDAF